MNWFVLRVASNQETSVRDSLLRKVAIDHMNHFVGRVLVPTETIKTIEAGKQQITESKLYPGYVFVEMQLEDDGRIPRDVSALLEATSGAGAFVGIEDRPTAMTLAEIQKMLAATLMPGDQPRITLAFEPGDQVTIKEGPFAGFEGTVNNLHIETGKISVLVTICGRQAPVELDEWQIRKADK